MANKKDNNKKDHIAIPDATLKWYRESGEDDFYYLDLQSKQICTKGPSMYQKQRGYYQKGFDDVCQRIETLIGDIRAHIDTLYKSNGGYSYDSAYLKSMAIDMLALQTARRPELLENVTKPDLLQEKVDKRVIDHVLSGRLTPQAVGVAQGLRRMFASQKGRRDFFYQTSFERMRDILLEAGQLHNYSAMIHAIPENIKATYLLTPFHYFIYCDCFIITLSPRYAVVLMPKVAFDELKLREGMAILVADESNVLRLIPSVIEATSPCTQKHIIGERYMLNKVLEFTAQHEHESPNKTDDTVKAGGESNANPNP